MKNWISFGLVFFLGLSLAGCSTMNSTVAAPNPDHSKEIIGLFSGAIIGGLAGSAVGQKGGGRVTEVAIGAALGGLVGFFVGKFVGDQDRDLAQLSAERNKQSLSPYKGTVQEPRNLQQASNPMVTTGMIQEFTLVGKGPMAKNKSRKSAKVAAAKNETSTTLSSLWRYLPSRQWFVNDMKQGGIG